MNTNVDIKRVSCFKDKKKDKAYLNKWVEKLEKLNDRRYERLSVTTSLGETVIYGLNTEKKELPALVIFPGFRTTSLIWDFDKGLDHLGCEARIFMVETNGQPNLSEGNSPDIKGYGYGYWANEVLEGLNLNKVIVAGASFGGIVALKLCIVHSEKVQTAVLLNPGCFTFASLTPKVMWPSMMSLLIPNRKYVKKFIEEVVFYPPHHMLSDQAYELLQEYEQFAIKRYKDRTQKPRSMKDQLKEVSVPVYLLQGDKDPLFPWRKNARIAKEMLGNNLIENKLMENVSHGIECYFPAMEYLGEIVRKFN